MPTKTKTRNAAAQAWTIGALTAIAGLYLKEHHG